MPNVDPILTTDLTPVNTERPLLPDNDYDLQLVKIEQTQNAAGTGNVLAMQFKTTQPCVAVTGEKIPAGNIVFHSIPITPTPNYTSDQISAELKRFRYTMLGNGNGAIMPLEQYVNKMAKRVHVSIQAAKGDFPERNRIRFNNPPKK